MSNLEPKRAAFNYLILVLRHEMLHHRKSETSAPSVRWVDGTGRCSYQPSKTAFIAMWFLAFGTSLGFINVIEPAASVRQLSAPFRIDKRSFNNNQIDFDEIIASIPCRTFVGRHR